MYPNPTPVPDMPIYIQVKGSQLVMAFQLGSPSPVAIDTKTDGNQNQKWKLTDSGIKGYIYIVNVGQNEVLTSHDQRGEKAYLTAKTEDR